MGEDTAFVGDLPLLYPVIIYNHNSLFLSLLFCVSLSLSTFLLIDSAHAHFHSDHTKNILVECVTSHIRQKDAASVYGSRLDSSSGRILLQGLPGL